MQQIARDTVDESDGGDADNDESDGSDTDNDEDKGSLDETSARHELEEQPLSIAVKNMLTKTFPGIPLDEQIDGGNFASKYAMSMITVLMNDPALAGISKLKYRVDTAHSSSMRFMAHVKKQFKRENGMVYWDSSKPVVSKFSPNRHVAGSIWISVLCHELAHVMAFHLQQLVPVKQWTKSHKGEHFGVALDTLTGILPGFVIPRYRCAGSALMFNKTQPLHVFADWTGKLHYRPTAVPAYFERMDYKGISFQVSETGYTLPDLTHIKAKKHRNAKK